MLAAPSINIEEKIHSQNTTNVR